MIRNSWSLFGRAGRIVCVALSGCLPAIFGCAPAATFQVLQPRLPGRQRDMTLTTMKAEYGRSQAHGGWNILIRFPLPGASSGRPKYVVYLHVPDISFDSPTSLPLGETTAARGFFIQRSGEGRGREVFTGGCVELAGGSGGAWSLKLAAQGELGTRIDGSATLRRRDLDARDYIEAHHRGDVADLLKPLVTTQKTAP